MPSCFSGECEARRCRLVLCACSKTGGVNMKKDLLKMLDLTREDIEQILDTADQMKFSQKHGIAHDHLRGKTLAMIFEKNSTRTRVSFEVGKAFLDHAPVST